MQIFQPSLDELIKRVDNGEIQLPKFQREFVWEVGKIHKLLVSMFKERPIGMATSWLQPQSKPHTDPIRFSIGDQPERSFGQFVQSPPVLSLVLDGRQRITALLHVFTNSLHAHNGKYTHANRWFINLDKTLGEEDSIEWCKVSKLSERRLDSVANALSQGRYPLSEWASIVKNCGLILQTATYPDGVTPDKEVMERRQEAMQQVSDTLKAFKLPIAQIGEQFDLSDVCEIFEILNTTGTRISVFDLIHNNLFPFDYQLRLIRKDLASSPLGSRLFGAQPEEYYSQFVTTRWIAASGDLKQKGADGSHIESLKAKHLLETPLEAYKDFESAVRGNLVTAAMDALDNCLGGCFKTQDSPYPVSLTLFVATWLETETTQQRDRLCLLFRSYYFRNSLLKRYTQGYLSKHTTDLRFLRDTIRMEPHDALADWQITANSKLDDHFGGNAGEDSILSEEDILEQILAKSPPDGAAGDLYQQYLLARHDLDLITGNKLDIFIATPNSLSVELHHIFPKKFLSLTAANYPGQLENVNCLANLVPLTRASNGEWKDKGPSTALQNKGRTWANSSTQFSRALIDQTHFDILAQTVPYKADDIDTIWKARAKRMAFEIFSAQQVTFTGFAAHYSASATTP